MSGLKAEGITIIVVLVVVVILLFMLGVYCHFCAETESGGHYYASDENIAKVVFVPTKAGKGEGPTGNDSFNKSKCKCSKKFKGKCEHCDGGGSFSVDEGTGTDEPLFTGFGGDKGLDPDWGNRPDPIRSALGGYSTETGGGDSSGGGFGMNMRDD